MINRFWSGGNTRVLALFAFCLLIGCGQSRTKGLEAENEELRSQVEQLQTQVAGIREKAETLESSSSALKDQMSRFQSEDWRDVLPDAEAASTEVETDQDDLKQAVDEIE